MTFKGSFAGHAIVRIITMLAAAAFMVISTSCSNDDPPASNGYITLDDADGTPKFGWSVTPGTTITFRLSSAQSQRADVRITNTAGEVVATIDDVDLSPQEPVGEQPWVDGFGYEPTCLFTVPIDWASGVYFIDGFEDLFFIVQDADQDRDIVVLLSTNTFNAYSVSGGRSLYNNHPKGSDKVDSVSFQRPMSQTKSREWLPLLEWITETGFQRDNIRYISDHEIADPAILEHAKVLIVVGHSEYWDRPSRENVDRFIDRGGDVAVFGANVMWWQIRYNSDGTQMICYKGAADDPIEDPTLKTGRWIEEEIGLPTIYTIGSDFRYGGYGKHDESDMGWNGFRIITPESPLLEGTNLARGQVISAYGKEYEGMPIVGLDNDGFPIPDLEKLAVHRAEIIGYDWGFRSGHTIGTFHALQRGPKTGRVVVFGTLGAAGRTGIAGPDGQLIQRIFQNTITKLLGDEEIFSNVGPREVEFHMTTPWKGDVGALARFDLYPGPEPEPEPGSESESESGLAQGSE